MGILILICVFASKSCISDYTDSTDEKKVSQCEQMLADSTVTIAVADSVYTVRTLKMRSTSINKTYEYKYSYQVDGKKYTGNYSGGTLLSIFEVYYLKSDPKIHYIDPQNIIEKELDKKGSIWDLLIGIVWGIIGIFSIITLVLTILSYIKKAKETI